MAGTSRHIRTAETLAFFPLWAGSLQRVISDPSVGGVRR